MYLKKIASALILNKPNIFEGYHSEKKYRIVDTNPIFITGCGRSGTHFLSEIFSQNTEIDNYHLDSIGNPIGDAYQIFSKWHELPVNNYEFINSRGYLIEKAKEKNKRYLESNPLIAFSVKELYEHFGGTIIIVYRNPQKAIESHYRKGWYMLDSCFGNDIPGYNYSIDRPNHYFSRITPKDIPYLQWKEMSRIKKIIWMWVNIYKKIVEDTATLKNVLWLNIDEFNYEQYIKTMKKINVSSKISEQCFNRQVNNKPGKGKTNEKVQWSSSDIQYYYDEVSPIWNRHIKKAITPLPEITI